MTIDLAQFKNAEAWEYGDACRQAYWSRFGTTTDAAFFGPTNGALSPWPGHAENFCPVFLPDSTIIATSGMSSPWDPDGWDEYGDTGEGLEYYLDSPRLAGAGMEEIRQSWELALIMSVVSHFAGQNYRPTFDFYDCLTLRTRPVEALEDWVDDEGLLCLLLGAASGVREDRIEMFGDPEAVRAELGACARLIGAHVELDQALSAHGTGPEERSALVTRLLGPRLSAAALVLVQHAARCGGRVGRTLVGYEEIASGVLGRRLARVTVARALPEDQAERLRAQLARLYAAPVDLSISVDPDVLGGVRVLIGDDVIDGTIAATLDQARRQLA